MIHAEKAKNIRFRNIFRLQNKNVKSFVIQLEVRISKENEAEKWNAVIRFDCAHNFPHLDLIDINGKARPKIPLQYTTFNEAIEIAMEEMKKYYKKWFIELGYESFYSIFFDEINMENEHVNTLIHLHIQDACILSLRLIKQTHHPGAERLSKLFTNHFK